MPSCEFPAGRITASLIFSGRKSARSDAGLEVGAGVAAEAGPPVGARFAASASVTTGVEVFSGKVRNPRGQQSQAMSPIFPEESPSRTDGKIDNRSRRQRLQKFDFAQRSVSLRAGLAAGPLASRSAGKVRSDSRRRFSPPGCPARPCQKASSAARSPLKILRSALGILAILFGKEERGRSHLPSPQNCQRSQTLHGTVARCS